MIHVVTTASGIAVYAAVSAAPADVHSVFWGKDAFNLFKVHKKEYYVWVLKNSLKFIFVPPAKF
jgi:hypothetical protein